MKKPFFTLAGLFICFAIKLYFQNEKLIKSTQIPNLKPLLASYQSRSIERYSFGFNNLIGASIWVQVLQNSDYHPVKDNEVSWEYAQIDTITTLDPNHLRAYDFGAVFISTLRRDKVGGKLLIEKWTKKQPNHWRPWYLLGMHHVLELKDFAGAAPYILKASKMAKSPDWLSSLGIRLMSESGQLYSALKTSLELLPQLKSQEGILRLSQRIRSLNYKIQKNQWQEALDNYLKTYKTLPLTISDLRTEVESKRRELSSIIADESNSELSKNLVTEKFEFKIDQNSGKIVSNSPENTDSLEKVGIFIPN